jgi:hypothetical protein
MMCLLASCKKYEKYLFGILKINEERSRTDPELDPDPDPLVRSMDPVNPDPDPHQNATAQRCLPVQITLFKYKRCAKTMRQKMERGSFEKSALFWRLDHQPGNILGRNILK